MLITKTICNDLSDNEIILKAQVQLDYFACLFERYEAKLLRYIKSMVVTNDQEAEDILQEAFIKIWKNMNAFDHRLKLSSWLYRIVHNQAISCLRKKKSYGKDQTLEWDETLYAEIPGELSQHSEKDLKEQGRRVQQMLNQLPLPYKEVLVLKFLENMSYDEISDILKIPTGTVATRINRAKKAFAALAAKQQISFDL